MEVVVCTDGDKTLVGWSALPALFVAAFLVSIDM